MAVRIETPRYAAIPAILAIAGAAFVLKPEALRRDFVLEAKGAMGFAQKYEVMYAACAREDAAREPSSGFGHRFPARSDADAADFVKTARPQCEVASLYRLEPRKTRSPSAPRYQRSRIDL